jgi:hypothetical protein
LLDETSGLFSMTMDKDEQSWIARSSFWVREHKLFSGLGTAIVIGASGFLYSKCVLPQPRDSYTQPALQQPPQQSTAPRQDDLSGSLSAISKLGPADIMTEIDSVRPAQRTNMRKSFIGASVEWNVVFADVDVNDQRQFLIFRTSLDTAGLRPFIACSTSAAQLDQFRLIDRGTKFHIKGRISNIDPMVIYLSDVLVSARQ